MQVSPTERAQEPSTPVWELMREEGITAEPMWARLVIIGSSNSDATEFHVLRLVTLGCTAKRADVARSVHVTASNLCGGARHRSPRAVEAVTTPGPRSPTHPRLADWDRHLPLATHRSQVRRSEQEHCRNSTTIAEVSMATDPARHAAPAGLERT